MNKVTIIAEAGVNHNGSLEMAKQLVDEAAKAGVDFVKFQTFKASKILCTAAPKADYQVRNTGNSDSQYEMIKALELSEADHQALIDHCALRKIQFLSTPFDLESIDLLLDLGLNLFKIPSGEITNYPYLRKIALTQKPVILSTGMCTLGEVEEALRVLTDHGLDWEQITLLHCNTDYPTQMGDVNLRAMTTIGSAFPGCKIGYSDHTLGIEIPIAAVALGACVIEKHFTLDRNLPGPDHKASLTPVELEAMVRSIRNVEIALGTGRKTPSESEAKNRPVARKSIVAAMEIRQGEPFSETNLEIKRPGTGISPMRWNEVIGKSAPRDFAAEELIEL